MDAEIKIQDGKSDTIKLLKTKYRLVKIINKGYFCQFRQNLDRRSTSFILPKYDEKRSTSFVIKLYAIGAPPFRESPPSVAGLRNVNLMILGV
jgi:hypothetical protein